MLTDIYTAHHEAITRAHDTLGISISKVTHAGRPFAATYAGDQGVGEGDIKNHGLWAQGVFRACYQHSWPKDTMLALAGFPPGSPHYVARERVNVTIPDVLKKEVFPWLESAEKALIDREKLGKQYTDLALKGFLALMNYLRMV